MEQTSQSFQPTNQENCSFLTTLARMVEAVTNPYSQSMSALQPGLRKGMNEIL